MRSFFVAAFMANILLGTTCMMPLVPVHAAEPVMMEEPAIGAPAESCHHEQEAGPSADDSCLNHCLSQATNRTVTNGGASERASPVLPVFLPTDSPAMISSSVPNTGTDFHPSPPSTITVVLLQ